MNNKSFECQNRKFQKNRIFCVEITKKSIISRVSITSWTFLKAAYNTEFHRETGGFDTVSGCVKNGAPVEGKKVCCGEYGNNGSRQMFKNGLKECCDGRSMYATATHECCVDGSVSVVGTCK